MNWLGSCMYKHYLKEESSNCRRIDFIPKTIQGDKKQKKSGTQILQNKEICETQKQEKDRQRELPSAPKIVSGSIYIEREIYLSFGGENC